MYLKADVAENVIESVADSVVENLTERQKRIISIIEMHIPEQCRPLSKSNRLFVNLFRSIVGHSFVESHTFALEMTGKGYVTISH